MANARISSMASFSYQVSSFSKVVLYSCLYISWMIFPNFPSESTMPFMEFNHWFVRSSRSPLMRARLACDLLSLRSFLDSNKSKGAVRGTKRDEPLLRCERGHASSLLPRMAATRAVGAGAPMGWRLCHGTPHVAC